MSMKHSFFVRFELSDNWLISGSYYANGPLSVTSHSPVATAGTFVSFQNTKNCFPNRVGAVYRFPGLNTNL